jgi:branched-chain amino acid transport system ATP-binding protein
MSDSAPLLEIDGLSAGYGAMTAVSGVRMLVHPGEVVALFGPNGAGKSTSLLATVGALPRRGGTVRWQGSPAPTTLHACVRAGLAFVPEQRSTISSLSTLDNLRLGRGSVQAALDYFPELGEHLGTPAGLLSGGQQQILILARTLASRPKALLIDELSLGLAPSVVVRLLEVLRREASETGLGVLLVEQQMRRALGAADRWYLMSHGTILASGAADEVGAAELEEAYRRRVRIGQP